MGIIVCNTSGNTWTAVYTANANDSLCKIKFGYSKPFDTSGNNTAVTTESGNQCHNGLTAPTFKVSDIASDNTNTSKAKAGDDVHINVHSQ